MRQEAGCNPDPQLFKQITQIQVVDVLNLLRPSCLPIQTRHSRNGVVKSG